MKITTKVTALLLTLLMVLSLSGCRKDGTSLSLRIGLVGECTVPDPAMVMTDSEKILVNHLYENLMKLAPNGEGGSQVTSGLARSYRCEDELDGTQTYTFTLRDGVKWSNGQPLTAGDFVYAWRRLADPATQSPNASLLSVVAGYDQVRKKGDASLLQVTAEDEHTLVVKLNCRCPYFLSAVCTDPATMPLYAEDTTLTNGAYCISEQRDGQLTLSVSSQYYDSKYTGPATLVFPFYTDTAELPEDCDIVLGQPGGTAWDNADPYPRTTVLLVNQSAPSLKNESLRQALSLVIDRNALSELAGGAYTAADGLVSSGILAEDGTSFRENNGALIDNEEKHYRDNCVAAQQKIVDAGLNDARSMASLGTVTLLYAKNDSNEQIVTALQQTWQKTLGITVTPLGVAEADMTAALGKGEFALALTEVTGRYNDATAFLNQFHSTAATNYGHYRSSAYNMLLRVAATSSSDEARRAYLEDAERLLLENGGVIPLYGANCCYQMRQDLTGLLNNGVGVYDFHYIRQVTNQ